MGKLANSIESMGLIFTALCLFILLFSFACWFVFYLDAKPSSKTKISQEENCGESYHLVCFWEDAPESALKGQCYHLATPLMTPFACIVVANWHHFYRENLGKPGIDYWQWLNFPEAKNICQELSTLLSLDSPQPQVKTILTSLAIQPLAQFNQGDFWQQTEKLLLFKHWHETSYRLLGKEVLGRVYQVCFNISWAKVTEILELSQKKEIYWWQVLQVEPEADASGVEKAYKKLMRYWHPDVNNHPYATEISTMINVAYQQYSALPIYTKPKMSFFDQLFSLLTFIKSWKDLPLKRIK